MVCVRDREIRRRNERERKKKERGREEVCVRLRKREFLISSQDIKCETQPSNVFVHIVA